MCVCVIYIYVININSIHTHILCKQTFLFWVWLMVWLDVTHSLIFLSDGSEPGLKIPRGRCWMRPMRWAIRTCSSSVSWVASRVWLGVGWYTGTCARSWGHENVWSHIINAIHMWLEHTEGLIKLHTLKNTGSFLASTTMQSFQNREKRDKIVLYSGKRLFRLLNSH